jgi:hypothetical protein
MNYVIYGRYVIDVIFKIYVSYNDGVTYFIIK